MKEKKLILASASPRRRELLERLTKKFEIQVCHDEEHSDADAPSIRVMELAEHKAKVVGKMVSEPALVIGSDTIVVLGTEVLGKPKDEEDAARMLTELSGNTHSVYTGVSLYDTETGMCDTFYEETKVHMIPLTEEEIRSYVATREPMDKAGAYGIQQGLSSAFVSGISGDYYTVVGLPLCALRLKLKEQGFTLS